MTGQGSKDASSSIWLAVERVGLPDKKYFKIGEVAALVGVEPHVLRYWQTQFPQVRPQKSRSGHRLYRRKDVETLLLVRELLHVQRFTIAGARQALRGLVKSERPGTGLPAAVDDEVPVARARPLAAPPRAAATEVMRVEAFGLEHDELDDALSRQLLEASAGDAITAVDAIALDDDAIGQGGPLLAARPNAAAAGDAEQVLMSSRSLETAPALASMSSSSSPASSAAMPERSTLPKSAATTPAARVTTTAVALPVPSSPLPSSPLPSSPLPSSPLPSSAAASSALRERARKEQLGFGFIPSNRGALEAARSEVLALMNLLDREDAAANRLRARPAAAKT